LDHLAEVIIFFYKAEDGRRDPLVTGVQTCALPIYRLAAQQQPRDRVAERVPDDGGDPPVDGDRRLVAVEREQPVERTGEEARREIGGASCRERVETYGGGGALQDK